MITTTLLQNELQEMKRIHNRCQKRRASLICRSLHTRFEHGKPRPYTVVNGKPTYIAQKNTELLQNIVQSKALQQLQPRLARNITLLEQIVKDYTPLPDLFSADLTAPIIQTIRGPLPAQRRRSHELHRHWITFTESCILHCSTIQQMQRSDAGSQNLTIQTLSIQNS